MWVVIGSDGQLAFTGAYDKCLAFAIACGGTVRRWGVAAWGWELCG